MHDDYGAGIHTVPALAAFHYYRRRPDVLPSFSQPHAHLHFIAKLSATAAPPTAFSTTRDPILIPHSFRAGSGGHWIPAPTGAAAWTDINVQLDHGPAFLLTEFDNQTNDNLTQEFRAIVDLPS